MTVVTTALLDVFYVQESRFAVFDLRFDCRYSVSLQPVSRDGITGHVTRLSVTPPPCRQVTVVGSVRPDCPQDEGVLFARDTSTKSGCSLRPSILRRVKVESPS